MYNTSGFGDYRDDEGRTNLPARQFRTVHPTLYPGPQIPIGAVAEPDDLATVIEYLRVFWKRKWIVLTGALVGIVASIAISLWMTPMYRATATLEIQTVNEPLFAGASILRDSNIATQVQLLSSHTLRERVEAKLNKKSTPPSSAQDPLASVRQSLGLTDPMTAINWRTAVSAAAGTTKVSAGRESRIVFVESRSPNPQAAADYANTLAQEYITQNDEVRWASYQGTGEWLGVAQQDLKKKVEASERRLQEFARSHGLLITQSQNTAEESLRQIQQELGKASSDRMTKRSVYESSLSSPTESLPEVLDSGPMTQYQLKIADLRRQLAELSTTLTPDHYKTQKVEAQIKELEAARDRERKNIISRIRIDYEAAQKREQQLLAAFKQQAGVLSGQAEHLIQYNILQREVESNKKLFDQTLAQGKEAGLASAMRANNARVVDQAMVPVSPLSPNLPLNLSLGTLGGILFGVLFVIVSRSTDARIQMPGIVASHINLRELGVIPSASLVPGLRNGRFLLTAGKGRGKAHSKVRGKARTSATVVIPANEAREPIELVTWTLKGSVISDAFRSTMTSILFACQDGKPPASLVITSPGPREGKTTVTANLAIALAEINHRVVLIDADMRLPRMHTIFDLPNTVGLSDFLHERKPPEEYVDEELVRETQIPNLYVMTAGPARASLAQLLYSDRLSRLMTRLNNSFDAVLIDSAPVMNVPDARILARAAGPVVLVIRANQTRQESALAAVRCFEEDGSIVLGTVLNDWNPKRAAYGGYGGIYGPEYGNYRR